MSQMYDEGCYRLVQGGSGTPVNVNSATIGVALFSAYTPSKTHQFLTDALGAGAELSCTGYARKTLTSPSVSKDTTNNQIVFTFANPVWSALGPTSGGPVIEYALIYQNTGSDSTSPL